MMRTLLLLLSALAAAGLFILAREHAAAVTDVALAGPSLLAAPVPVIAAALCFPALYLLWEQSEL